MNGRFEIRHNDGTTLAAGTAHYPPANGGTVAARCELDAPTVFDWGVSRLTMWAPDDDRAFLQDAVIIGTDAGVRAFAIDLRLGPVRVVGGTAYQTIMHNPIIDVIA